MTRDHFIGRWELDPSESNYTQGQPPESATYEIETAGGGYRFIASWTKGDGAANRSSYVGMADGEAHPLPEPSDYADAIQTTRVTPNRMDTLALKDGRVVNHAVRQLSEDLQTMEIIQTGPTASHGEYRNRSLYRRSSS